MYDALKDEARDTVKMPLGTTGDEDTIIQTLELHFGNRNVVARRIRGDIPELPDISNDPIHMVTFANKLRNVVDAFKTLKFYIDSPDLIKSVANKLPVALEYVYNRFENSTEGTNLETISNFLHEEAERVT